MARRRSTRSHALELLLGIGLVVVSPLWLRNGGPAAFGKWFAGEVMPTPAL